MSVASILADIATEFASVDTSRRDRLITLAALQVPSAGWGDVTEHAQALLVAHWLKLDAQRGKGAVTEETIGDVSRSFAKPGGKDADEFDATSYGAEFKRLRRTRLAGPLVT